MCTTVSYTLPGTRDVHNGELYLSGTRNVHNGELYLSPLFPGVHPDAFSLLLLLPRVHNGEILLFPALPVSLLVDDARTHTPVHILFVTRPGCRTGPPDPLNVNKAEI